MKILYTFIVCLLVVSHSTLGGGSANIPLKMLTEKADAIIVAQITIASMASEQGFITVTIEKVFKGPLRAGSTIVFAYQISSDAAKFRTTILQDRGLFFLTSTQSGAWMLLPARSGYIPTIRDAFFVIPKASQPRAIPVDLRATLHEQIVAEVVGAVESGAPRGASVDLASEYRLNPSPAMKHLVIALRTSNNPMLRGVASRAAIASGDEQAVSQLAQSIATLSQNEVGALAQEMRYHYKNPSSASVAQLGRLLTATVPLNLREAAAIALARIHTKEALPHLAPLLDSTDARLRAVAVGGLAMFANNVPIGEHHPALGDWKYRTELTMKNSAMDEGVLQRNPAILSFWKGWWGEHRAELEGPRP